MPSDATRIPDPAVRALTRQIAELTREVETLKRGQRTSQLGNSSLDDGTLWFTQGGVKRVSIGKQVDGKFGWGAVNGDPPPRPTPAILEAGTNGVTIGWDGQFVGNPPSDFVHVKAFLSPVGASFIPSDGNCVGHFLGRAKLPVSPLDQTGYWAILIAYNTSGVASEPSIVQGPVTPQPVVATEILDGIVTEVKLANDAVTAAKIATGAVGTAQLGSQSVDLSKLADGSVDATKIVDGSITPAKVTFTAQDIGSVATYNQPSQPSGAVPAGSLWFDGSKLRRYSGSAWVELTDAGIADALSAAQQAQTDAANALNTASGAQAAVAGKVTVYYQSTSPSGANTGDLWINTGNQNRLSRWSGSAWVAVEDQRIAAALVNAQTAQATADGKITAFYQATAPTTGMGVGDFWYKSDAGNLPHRWNGTTWVPLPAGSGAIADGAVTAGKIAGSAVDVSKLADGSVNAAKILNGAVVQDKIAANAVGANQIAANAITAGKIAANVVGANELAANSVIAGKIAADAVTATNIAAGSIQAQHIAAAQILAEKIASGAITTEKLAALSITADKMAANSVTAGSILAGAVTADKLEALLVLASTIIAGDPNDWHLELGDPVTPLLYWNNDSTGFAVSRDPVTGQSNAYLSGRIEFGNGSQIEQDYLDLCEQASTGFQTPKPRQSRTLIYSDPVTTPNPQPSWASATGRGSLLLLSINAINYASTGAPTLTVPSGWQLVRTQTYGSTGSARSSLYYIPNSGSSRTREAISASIASSWSVSLVEYSGIAATALDVSAGTTGSSSTASTGTTGAAAQNNELQVAFFHTLTAATPGKSGFGSPTGGFSTLTGSGGNRGQGGMVAARTTAAGGTASSTSSTSGAWSAMVATFRTAVAAPVPSPPPSSVVRLFTRRMASKSTPYTIDDAGQSYPVGRLPYARVRLTTSPTFTASTDVYAQGDWAATADIYGMVALSTSAGTFTNITIPVSGNWLVDFKAIFQTSTNTTSNIVAFVTKNGRTRSSDSVASDSRKFNAAGGDASPVQATRVIPLQAGDVLYWGTWSNATAQVLSSALNILTEMSVHFMGPNY